MRKFLLTLLALAMFSAVALADPSADQLLAEGRLDDAIMQLQNWVNRDAQNAQNYNLLCRAYFAVGNWDAGISACEKASSLDPSNSQYHLWLGRIYGEKAAHSGFVSAAGLAKRARNEFESAVRLNPSSVEARTDLAEFYIEAPGIIGGGKDKAAAQADKLAQLDPVKAGWVKARIAEKNKDFTTAEKEYRGAIQASQGRADAWVNLARFYRNTSRYPQMEDAIKQASSSQLPHPGVLMDAAEVLIRANRDFQTASQLLRRYLAIGNGSEEEPMFKAHYLLGTLLERQGDKQAAAQEYRTALSEVRNFSPAKDALDRLDRQAARTQRRSSASYLASNPAE